MRRLRPRASPATSPRRATLRRPRAWRPSSSAPLGPTRPSAAPAAPPAYLVTSPARGPPLAPTRALLVSIPTLPPPPPPSLVRPFPEVPLLTWNVARRSTPPNPRSLPGAPPIGGRATAANEHYQFDSTVPLISLRCLPFFSGTFSGSGSSTCVDCPAGRYSSSSASFSCLICPAYSYSGPAASSCSACAAGRSSPTVLGSSKDMACGGVTRGMCVGLGRGPPTTAPAPSSPSAPRASPAGG